MQIFPIDEMDRFKISKLEKVPSAPDRVNIPCLIHDPRL